MSEASIEKRGSTRRILPGDDGRVLVFGDIHGDLEALKRGLDIRKPEDVLVFLGDYADRGAEGVEVIEGIDTLLDKYPRNVVALTGNHEEYSENGEPSFSPCTLIDEVQRKRGGWDEWFRGTFSPFIKKLSLSAYIPGIALFVHGGVDERIGELNSLENPEEKVQRSILWSDPGPGEGTAPNMRGAGSVFGEDISTEVLDGLGLSILLRSHEPRKAFTAPAVEHNGRVVTVSSTSVYGGRPFMLVLDEKTLRENVRGDELSSSVIYLDQS